MPARWAAALVLGFALALAMPATALAAEGDKAASADDGAAAPKESVELVCKTTLAGVRGWQSTDGGKLAGRKSGSAAVTALRIAYKGTVDGSIKYQTYQATGGWSDYVAANKTSGTKRAANPIQALRVKLTGDVADRYNVYYRANLVGYGWTGWGKNGEQVGAPKLAGIRAYQVKIAPKKGTAAKKANKKYNTKKARKNHLITTKTASEMSMRLSMAAKAQGQSSKTKWLILVDTHKNRVCVLKGKKGQWNVHKFFKCSSGAPGSRTVRGKFTIGSRGLSFGEDKGYSCWYWTQFYGNYLFHSVLYNPGSKRSLQDGRLGMNLSHGCVRLAIGNAKWINRNIPSGTKVWTY